MDMIFCSKAAVETCGNLCSRGDNLAGLHLERNQAFASAVIVHITLGAYRNHFDNIAH